MQQLSFADIEISRRSKKTRIAITLDKINMVVDWKLLEEMVSGLVGYNKRRATAATNPSEIAHVVFATPLQPQRRRN